MRTLIDISRMQICSRCLTRVGVHATRAVSRVSVHSNARYGFGSNGASFNLGASGHRSNSIPRVWTVETRHLSKTNVRAHATSPITVGDKLPEAKFNYFDADGNMKEITTTELCSGKKVVLFAVPGAFTPTCSLKHLPGFVAKSDDLKAKGVDTIACVAVNDAFVMDAWGKSIGAEDKIMLLADGSALFTKSIGVDLDLTDKGLGIRSRRYAMLVDDMEVKVLKLEEGGAFTLSSAEDILAEL